MSNTDNVVIPLLSTYLSGYVVALITGNVDFVSYIIDVLTLIAVVTLFHFFATKIHWNSFANRFIYYREQIQHL